MRSGWAAVQIGQLQRKRETRWQHPLSAPSSVTGATSKTVDMAVVGVGNVLELRGDEHLRPSGPRWGKVFGGNVVTAVMIDRLVHLAGV